MKEKKELPDDCESTLAKKKEEEIEQLWKTRSIVMQNCGMS